MVRNPFKRKKEEKKAKEVIITDLERFCGDDDEVHKALWHTMFLDPRKITVSLEDAAKKAADSEKRGNNVQANVWYHIAGALAIWKGDAAKVQQYFTKCATLATNKECELITKIPERAVEKAQEYYKMFLK